MLQTPVGWGLFIQELCLFACFFSASSNVLSVQFISSNLQFASCIRLLVSASNSLVAKLDVILIWQKHLQARVCSHRSYVYLLNPVSVRQVLDLIRAICNFTASNNFLRLPIFLNLLTNRCYISLFVSANYMCRVSSSISRYCYFYILVALYTYALSQISCRKNVKFLDILCIFQYYVFISWLEIGPF